MNDTEKTVLLGAGLIGLAVLGGAWILAYQLDKSLREINLFKDDKVQKVLTDVHNISEPVGNFAQLVQSWTRA